MTYYNKIDNIRNQNYKQRFINELDCLTKDDAYKIQNICKDNDASDAISNRVIQLKTIIKNIDNRNDSNKKNMFDELEKYMYKKPWHRLNNIHKINKLKEFVKENMDDQKEEILKELIDLVNKKKINTKKAVDYDYENEKILSINVLKYNKKLKKYEIKVKK